MANTLNKFVATANVQAFVGTAESLISAEAGVPGLALVHGMRGLGKTRTAVWYAAKSGSVYLRSKSVWSPSWMLEEMAVELGLVPGKRKKDLFVAVSNALKEHPRLIVVDEANLPPTVCLECIRDLHDIAENPFILIGHEGIVDRLQRMGPFFDRFLYLTEFKPLGVADLTAYCQACLGLEIDSEAVAKVLEITGGNFRKSIVALKGLKDRAKMNGSVRIGLDHFKRAA